MFDWLLALWVNPFIAVLCYWLPLTICFFGYLIRTNENYQKDVIERAKWHSFLEAKKNFEAKKLDEAEFKRAYPRSEFLYKFSPTDTYGTLLGRGLLTITPVANIFAAIFDVSPHLFKRFFDWIRLVFNTPIVKPIDDDD